MPVVGTAGHVDHGKSTLIEALTGRDPDRLEEEKRRGLTIDLGFAWAHLDDDLEVGFVDGPGHERFIKNMLAGIEAVQAVLFVVAADEGWMPQSEEHLAVIDMLDIEHGVVALTRVDLVDSETTELAAIEIQEMLAGTSLAGSPIVPVAAPAGEGVADLRAALADVVRASPPVLDSGRPRLWVDRSFVIAGSGTVVTGTLSGGRLEAGDEATIWPGEHEGRIRTLQSHERSVEVAEPGSRTAVNLSGLEKTQIARGAMLGQSGHWMPSDEFLAQLRRVRSLPDSLGDRGAYHVHLGSGSWPATLRLVGEGDLALVRTAQPVPITFGDHFIIRDTGRRAVIGGGRVLEPSPRHKPWRSDAVLAGLKAALGGDADHRADALLDARKRSGVGLLSAHSAGGRPVTGMVAGDEAISDGEAERLRSLAVEVVDRFHVANPMRPGIPKASLAGQLGISLTGLEALLATTPLVAEGTSVRAADFEAGLGPAAEEAWHAARDMLSEAGLAVPRAGSLGLDLEALHALDRSGQLVMVADDLVYLPDQIDEIREGLPALGDDFTVASFRDAFGITRRQAVPLLEWLDRQGVTVRHGDLRSLRERSSA